MIIKKITCKTALSTSKLPGLDYSLNPYRGCEHKCVYCYAPNILRIPRATWGNFIEVKENIPSVLSKELKTKKKGVIGLSTVTDPYQPIEKKYKITRACLKQNLEYDFPISIQTKSTLIERDIEILKNFSNIEIIITISTLNDYERKLLEPNSSPIEKRLMVLKNLSDCGLNTCVFFGPIYPSILEENVQEIINVFKENGANKIWIDKLNLKPGVWDEVRKKINFNKKLLNIYQKNIFECKNHYNEIRKKIIDLGKEKDIKIVDAF
jgi:DNA repair photolyase